MRSYLRDDCGGDAGRTTVSDCYLERNSKFKQRTADQEPRAGSDSGSLDSDSRPQQRWRQFLGVAVDGYGGTVYEF